LVLVDIGETERGQEARVRRDLAGEAAANRDIGLAEPGIRALVLVLEPGGVGVAVEGTGDRKLPDLVAERSIADPGIDAEGRVDGREGKLRSPIDERARRGEAEPGGVADELVLRRRDRLADIRDRFQLRPDLVTALRRDEFGIVAKIVEDLKRG